MFDLCIMFHHIRNPDIALSFITSNINYYLGVKIGNKKVSILLYADDIALLSDTDNGLQAMLNVVYK